MKHRCHTLALLLALMLGLTACAGKPSESASQGSFGKLGVPNQNAPTELDTAETFPTSVTIPEEPAAFAFSKVAQASLDDLCAHRDQEYMAAAYLGQREAGDTRPLSTWLQDTNPGLASYWPFLKEIPEETVFGEYGDLYCVVPLVDSTHVAVKAVQWETLGNGMQPNYSEAVYYGEVGMPFLMYIQYNDSWSYEPDLVIEYVRKDGFVATWFPEQEAGHIFRPDENGHSCVIDFALLYDLGDYVSYLYDGPDAESQWYSPTMLGLGNTIWYSDNGWMLQFGYDETAESGIGGMVLYEPLPEGEDVLLTRYCHGTWWMEDDCLNIDAYNDQGEMVGGWFPVRISPSGEQLVIIQSSDGAVLPFFPEGKTIVGLTLSYG